MIRESSEAVTATFPAASSVDPSSSARVTLRITLTLNDPATEMLSLPTAPASPAAIAIRSPLRVAEIVMSVAPVRFVLKTSARVFTSRTLTLSAPAIDFESCCWPFVNAAPPVAVTWKNESLAVTEIAGGVNVNDGSAGSCADVLTRPASTIDATVVSSRMFTETAPASPRPLGGGSRFAPRTFNAFALLAPGAAGGGPAGIGSVVMNEPATANDQRTPSTFARTSTLPITSICVVARAAEPSLVVTSGSAPITARVFRWTSFTETDRPRPRPLPLTIPPTQLTSVSRLPA
jgi:hypothetical protein